MKLHGSLSVLGYSLGETGWHVEHPGQPGFVRMKKPDG